MSEVEVKPIIEYEYRVLFDSEQIYRGVNEADAIRQWQEKDKSVLERRRVGPWELAQ